ncbi:LysR substrate-binding domain-containing protein [Dechloromonas sp. CZR5]|uniref:LysR substrate-binding domain-containing protein n=1 Tax=Dechloromonas sp. CZR5 TaxID=2608630 RepID=UPI00351A7AC3
METIMDLRHLKYFIAVAEELNIGRAALRLHISQPPLTRQIQQLEEELDVQLLIRTPRGVELTQAGEMFLEEARNIRSLVEQAIERTKRAGQGKLGRLDIGIFGTGILNTIPKLLQLFRDDHPDVRVVLHTMTKNEQIEALRQKRITVGFNRIMSPLPDITCELIMREPLFLAVHNSHPLSKNVSVSVKELSKHPLVLFPTGPRPNFVDRVLEICGHMGFIPEISQIVGDAVTGVALVAGGFGISVVPESVITFKPPGIVYLPFDDWLTGKVDLSCIYRKDDESPILKAFLIAVNKFREQHKG